MEKRFWDDELQLTGQVDFITRGENGNLIVVDLKTSYRPSKTWQAQGCAYAMLAKKQGYKIAGIEFIHLNKHGKEPSIHSYDVDDQFFMSIYRTYQHFYQGKK